MVKVSSDLHMCPMAFMHIPHPDISTLYVCLLKCTANPVINTIIPRSMPSTQEKYKLNPVCHIVNLNKTKEEARDYLKAVKPGYWIFLSLLG